MKVTLEYQFQIDAYEIFVTDGDHIIRFDGHHRIFEKFDASTRPEPSLILPGDVLAQLAAAASDVLPPSAALQRHLADAITVRDRLLTMVERP